MASAASGSPSLSTPSHSSCEDLEGQAECATPGDVLASLLKSKAVLRIADELWDALRANSCSQRASISTSSSNSSDPSAIATAARQNSDADSGRELQPQLLDYDRYMRMHFAIQVRVL
eukprot:tig00001041_g6553.t1